MIAIAVVICPRICSEAAGMETRVFEYRAALLVFED